MAASPTGSRSTSLDRRRESSRRRRFGIAASGADARHSRARRLRRARDEGKIASGAFARERKVPYFGICFGMQMACIEGARNTAGIAAANRPSSAKPRSRSSAS
jgi:hypothetical protein